MKELLLIAVGSALVNNVVLSQFLGLCPFLGVSKNVKTSAGMGAAVIFVITIASAVTSVIYKGILVQFKNWNSADYCVYSGDRGPRTVRGDVFKKSMPSLYEALGVYLPLITTNCAVLGVALTNVQKSYSILESVINGVGIFRWIYHRHRNAGRCARENRA